VIKRLLLLLLFAIGALLIVLLYNTLTFNSKQVYEESKPAPRVTDSSIVHFQRAIQFRTISVADPVFDSASFRNFHSFLRATYPLVHQRMQLQNLAGLSLLFRWQGSDESLNPYVLMAHQDVVPIEEATRGMWTSDPFAGVIDNEAIHGRGTADDKINLIGMLEVAEKLLTEGFVPRRTIYFAFGHDEEVGGTGAKAIAAYLKLQNVTADLVLDEGGPITTDKVPGMKKPVALIGIAEKGFLTIELTVTKIGGHSSQPEKESAMTILAKALVALQENPLPAAFTGPTDGFIDYVGPEMPYPDRIVFANKWLFSPLIISIYEQSPGGNALVRTTTAPTIFNSGMKENVIPAQATASVNFRLLPGDESEEVIAKVKEIISDDRVEITAKSSFIAEASEVTPVDGTAFALVSKTVHQVFPETVVAPFLMIGATDSRHLSPVSTQIIKFSPMTDPIGYHGINEHVTVKSYGDVMWFFENLIRSAGAQEPVVR
jgi:carboxypeptidase PM20D1